MKASDVLEKINGWNKPTRVVSESELPIFICTEGTGCDCKGCDKG